MMCIYSQLLLDFYTNRTESLYWIVRFVILEHSRVRTVKSHGQKKVAFIL